MLYARDTPEPWVIPRRGVTGADIFWDIPPRRAFGA